MRSLYKIWILTALLASASISCGQSFISVSGAVMSSGNGYPVPGHPVHILLDDHMPHHVVHTGPDGTFSDSIFVAGMQIDSVIVATRDCMFEWHEQVFHNLNQPVYAEFFICVDSMPGSCQALFSWQAHDENPLQVLFTDLSTGNILHWMWDFGDGTSSGEPEPVHTYAQPGEYMVCLGVQGMDSLFPCFDLWCAKVTVGDSTAPLVADFIFYLDTVSPIANQYTFISTSTGNISQYSWDFGDGSTGAGAQVTHQYEEGGTYNVCLTVTDENPEGNSDQECKTLITPEYTFFGGQVFAGGFPLNNPVPAGDTGIAFLYRFTEESLQAVDTQYFFNEFGLYAFNTVLPGNYLVKVELTENSTHYTDYFPTYYPQDLRWQSAGTLNLGGPVQDANIHMQPTKQDLPQGPGTISGTVAFSSDSFIIYDPGDIEVILMNKEMKPLRFTKTDRYGNYTFSGLGLGKYMVQAEETGWNSDMEEVSLSPSNPSVFASTLFLEEITAFGLEEYSPVEQLEGPWPNPASDILHFSVSLQGTGKLAVAIMDLTGRKVYDQGVTIAAPGQVLSVPVYSLKTGVYLLMVTSAESGRVFVKKFIR